MTVAIVKQITIEKKVFQFMLDKAIGIEPSGFVGFDKTQNVQDQLQEIGQEIGKGHPLELIDKFHTFCMWDEQFEEMRENLLPTSLEQLWLAFIMKEKYQKIWNGEDWR